MWINKYVHHAYRPTKLPKSLCVKSAFHWTNETINIWSHFLGFLYFSWCQIYNNFYRLPNIHAASSDHLVFTLSTLGAQICMILSASYHTFGCSSECERNRWLKFDVFGISAGLIGMYLSGIYTAFLCFEDWLSNYLCALLVLFIFTMYIPFQKEKFDKQLLGSRFGYLHLTYSCVITFGLLPTVHWVILHGGLDNDHVSTWLPNIMVLYGLIAIAFVFYVSLIPERLLPGVFDVVGCSHQWWHVFILAAMVWWQQAGMELLTYLRLTGNSCQLIVEQTRNITNITSSHMFTR
uniref:Progestin and adipoQ receptor family member 3 n=1 Tax=Steinernema glaseri TaxID=37863 RepID=A0A1I7ZKH0_9BILA